MLLPRDPDPTLQVVEQNGKWFWIQVYGPFSNRDGAENMGYALYSDHAMGETTAVDLMDLLRTEMKEGRR